MLKPTIYKKKKDETRELSKCKTWSCKRSHPEPRGEPQPHGGPQAARWLPFLHGHTLQQFPSPRAFSLPSPSELADMGSSRRGRHPGWRPGTKPWWLCEVGAVAPLGRQHGASDLSTLWRCWRY